MDAKDEARWDALDQFFCAELLPPDPALDAALAASAEGGLRAINVSPNQGKLLHLLAKMQGARRILEIGTLGGYSAIWLARALPPDGTLLTLEIDPVNVALAEKNLARAGLAGMATVVPGPAAQSLDRFLNEGVAPFDMVFIDADKKSYPDYLERVVKMLRPGGIIVGDNVARRGRVLDNASDDEDVLGLRRFFKMLAADPQFSTTAIQTVGSKGWDGFSLSRRES